MLTEEQIRDALRVCYDPEIPLNIVDLGLIRGIQLDADPDAPGSGIAGVPARQSVTLHLSPASTGEAQQAQLLAVVENRLWGMPELSRVSVRLVCDPAWTPASITPDGRLKLGLPQPQAPSQFAILNNRIR